MAGEDLRVRLLLDASGYTREAREAATATGKIAGSAENASTQTGRLQSRFSGMSTAMKGAAVAGVAVAGAAVVKFGMDSIQAAARAEQAAGGIAAVFGEGSRAWRAIEEFGQISAEQAGLSQAAFYEAATSIGNSLINAGVPMDEVGQKTIDLTQRAADMAATFGGPVEESLTAIQAALRGEFDPIERFTGGMNAAAVEAKALEMGLAATKAEIDSSAKTTATLALIMERTAAAQGQFNRESDTASGKLAILSAKFEDMKARVGDRLLPIFVELLGTAEDLLPAFEQFATAIADVVRQAMPLITFLGDAAAFMAKYSGSTEDAIQSTDGLTRGVEAGTTAFAQGLNPAKLWAVAVETVGVNADRAAQHEEFLNRSLENTPDHLENIVDPAGKAGEAAEGFGRKIAYAGDQTQRQIDKLRELAGEMLALTNPVFGAINSWQRYQEVIAKIDEDGERTAEEILELAEAALGAVDAFAQLDPAEQEAAFQTIADAAGVPLDVIRDIAEELGFLDGQTFTTSLILQYEERGAVRASREELLRQLESGGEIVTSGPQARAHGGPVQAYRPYMVGERGPEMIVPTQSGYVMDATTTRTLMQSSGDQNITVHVATEAQAAQVASIMAANRALVRGGLPGGAR